MTDRKVRLGIVGAGWWGTSNHIPILKEREKDIGDVELVGVCRLGKKELKMVQDRFDIKLGTEDYRDMFDWDLDGIIIATPHECHYEQAKASLEHGLHVMCEKAMVLDEREAWELVHLAEEKKRHLLVPHGWHYFDFIEKAHDLMLQKKVGNVEYVMCHTATPTRELFSGEDFQTLPAHSEVMFEVDKNSFSRLATGGGYSWGQLSHSISMMLFVTGLTPDEVFAYISTHGAKNEPVDMHDAATVRFKEGPIGVISGSSGVPPEVKFQVEVNTYGDEGMLLLDVERERMELYRKDKDNLFYDIPKDGGIYDCEIPPHRFVELIKGEDKPNNSSGRLEAKVVSTLCAIHRSGKSGKPEKVLYY